MSSIPRMQLQIFFRSIMKSMLTIIRRLVFGVWAERQLRRRGYLEFLRLRPPHAFKIDCVDQWFLYRTVRKRKPHCVLEFGSGFSTVMIAQALWENAQEPNGYRGKIYSLDSEKEWARASAEAMPSHLAGFWDIAYGPAEETEYAGIPVFRHLGVPDVAPDLIYIDGPALTKKRQVAIDALFLEEHFQPGLCIIIDGRRRQADFFLQHFKRRYRFKRNRIFKNFIFELVT